MVLKRRPGSRLVLIGGADSDQMRHFKKLAKELSVLESVDFKGFLSDEEVVRTLNSSKMFVFPSSREGFAQAVSQAMACGLCCVISDIPALRETYGEVAFLVPPRNPVALADQIASMLTSDTELLECGVRSRQFVQKFDWGAVVDKELYALRQLTG
jgi:glycosyltransferase involved in cell wall biosynthesis